MVSAHEKKERGMRTRVPFSGVDFCTFPPLLQLLFLLLLLMSAVEEGLVRFLMILDCCMECPGRKKGEFPEPRG